MNPRMMQTWISHYKFQFKQTIQFNKNFDVICSNKSIKLRIKKKIKLFAKNYKIKECRLTVSDFIPLHKTWVGNSSFIMYRFNIKIQ